ncbi:MAG: CGNR zinc finger domain-containing protein [Nitriliruptoraceae bacterium]|nr:CGNR zinc finger domain-containing protein [Nitriliruptoraceae bacterium]
MFAHDTEVALRSVVALVNTSHDGDERLDDPGALDAFLDQEGFTGRREGTARELAEVHDLRATLRRLWDTDDEREAVGTINGLLADARTRPQLTRHDAFDWHLHMTDPDAPLVDRMGTEAAMALVDLLRLGEFGRLRRCAAQDCDAVLVDLSRNRSRRYCDIGNCGNRQHVAAYRARQAADHDQG